jgi:hypothetical protein
MAFVSRGRGCGLEEIVMPRYYLAREAQAFAALRKRLGLGLRDAAVKLGIRAVELSGLEHGRLVPEDPSAWAELARKLEGRNA